MEGLLLVKRIPSSGLAVGLEVAGRNHLPAAKVTTFGTRAASASGGSTVEASAAKQSYKVSLGLRRLWPRGGVASAEEDGEEATTPEKAEELKTEMAAKEQRVDDWVSKILRVRSMWAEREERAADGDREASAVGDGDRCVGCSGSGVGEADDSEGCFVGDEEEEKMEFDRESFSRLLRRVPLSEMEAYSKMAYLGSLAYIVCMIKPKNLLKCYRLRFVTSSVEEKAKPSDSDKEQEPSQDLKLKEETSRAEEDDKSKENSFGIGASTATHLQSQTMTIHPKICQNGEGKSVTPLEASHDAAMNSATAVGAGEEEMEQTTVKDMKSAKSLPCEWFICDDDKTATRYFVIQGSETLASWQTNLLFEPVLFEGMDVPVHRGIYEAAKGMYQQMLPEVRAHLKAHGKSATLRFTGHSLGGSLSVLLSLMLLIRGEATAESLLPVITFGAPSIMCGGDNLLRELGLPKSHVHAITMHRDIVPRAFSCNYPDHVAQILKAVNGNFRNHPCLENQKLLYGPMGKLLILQPDEKFSPCHHLLPPGSGLYNLGNSSEDSGGSVKTLRAATLAFLNSPHPLEILSDRSAYGSEGTVYRDHDTNSYLMSVRAVIRKEIKLIRKARREQRRKVWWPLVATEDVLHGGAVISSPAGLEHSTRHQFCFAGVFRGGRQALSRFRRLVASQHVHAFVVLFFSSTPVALWSILHCKPQLT